MANKATPPPYNYKKKYARTKYKAKGEPHVLKEADLTNLHGWIPITEEEENLYEEVKSALRTKNEKQRNLLITFSDPTKKSDGTFSLKIEVLHVDYRGFSFYSEGRTIQELERKFWPNVQKLMAYYLAPKLLKDPTPTLFNEDFDLERM